MRSIAITAAALTLAAAPLAQGEAFTLPHILEVSGSIEPAGGGPGTTFSFDTTIFATYGVDATGPNGFGEYSFTYSEPLSFAFADSGGSEIIFDLLISQAVSRPVGGAYHTSFVVQPVWRSYAGVAINSTGAAYQVSSVHLAPEAGAAIRLLDGEYVLQATQLAGFDDRGRDIAMNFNAGTLTIPAPAGAALLAAAGMMATTRRRRQT